MHRLKAFLSTLGVLFGVAALTAVLAIGEGAKRETLEQIGQLGMDSIIVRHAASSRARPHEVSGNAWQGLAWRDAEALRQNVSGLAAMAPLKVMDLSVRGTLSSLVPEVLATTPALQEIKRFGLAEGRFLCDLDRKEKRLVCILGADLAEGLGKLGHVGEVLRLDDALYEVVGVLKPMEWKRGGNRAVAARNFNKVLFIPLSPFLEFFQGGVSTDALSEILLQIRDGWGMERSAEEVKNILHRLHEGHEDYQIVVPKALFDQAHRTQQTFDWVLGGMAAMSLLVGGVGIMNIMLAAVSERTREVGIRRASGASRRSILLQFLLEALLLTLFGGLMGMALGVGFAALFACMGVWKMAVSPGSLLFSLAASMAVGLCSGLYPASKAAWIDPIEALRHY